MEVILLEEALADLEFWKRSLIQEIQTSPFSGTGKPEALKHELTGKWSRRISHEDRLVYRIVDEKILVYSLKGHY